MYVWRTANANTFHVCLNSVARSEYMETFEFLSKVAENLKVNLQQAGL